MNRRATFHGVLCLAGPAALGTAVLLLLALAGCTNTKDVLRPQKAEETARERYGVSTIGEYCEVSDVDPKYVGGIGIVTGLNGTGGDSPKDENRAALEKYLRQRGATSISEILNSGSAALVIVSGAIPPGTRFGEHFDIEVTLPRGSKATSLRGGVLEACVLSTYDIAHGPEGASTFHQGLPIATAEGPLQLSLGQSEGDENGERFTKAHIWEGGRSRIENTLSLLLNSDQQLSRKSNQMAARINYTFEVGSAADVQLAAAHKAGVSLRVPAAYKLNVPHYLRVVRLIPMQDPDDQAADAPGQPKTYRQRLAEDLLDPARTVTSALRLEALGQKSAPVLEAGLKSPHPLVRFCAAESLTYLGHGAGALVLADLIEQQPLLRSYALSALASLDENVTRSKLEELMEKGTAHETRYGAFRALQALDPHHPLTQGELLNKSFWLHRVAPESQALLHLTTVKRAEIVQFGPEAKFVPPFAFESNGYVVTAKTDDDHCFITFVPKHAQQVKVACSLNVSDVVHLLAKLDATYPEIVEILQDAANGKKLNCPVAFDALPDVQGVEKLVAAGKNGGDLLDLGGQDLGATPTLYEHPAPKPVSRNRDVDTDRPPRPEETPGETSGQQ